MYMIGDRSPQTTYPTPAPPPEEPSRAAAKTSAAVGAGADGDQLPAGATMTLAFREGNHLALRGMSVEPPRAPPPPFTVPAAARQLKKIYQRQHALGFTQHLRDLAQHISAAQLIDLLNEPLLQQPLAQSSHDAVTPGDALSVRYVTHGDGRGGHWTQKIVTANGSQIIANLAAIYQAASRAAPSAASSSALSKIPNDLLKGTREVRTVGGRGAAFYSTVGGSVTQSALANAVRHGDGALTGALIQAGEKNNRPDMVILATAAADQGLGLPGQVGVPTRASDAPLLQSLLPPAPPPPPATPHPSAAAIRKTNLAWQGVQTAYAGAAASGLTPASIRPLEGALGTFHQALWDELRSSYPQLSPAILLSAPYSAWLQKAVGQVQTDHPSIAPAALATALPASIVLQEAQLAQGGVHGGHYVKALQTLQQGLAGLPSAAADQVLIDPYVSALNNHRIEALLADAHRAQRSAGGTADLAALRTLGQGLQQADPTGAVSSAILGNPYTHKLVGGFVAAASKQGPPQVTLPLLSTGIQAASGSPELAVMVTSRAMPTLKRDIANASANEDQATFYSSLASITSSIYSAPGGAPLVQTLVNATVRRTEGLRPVMFHPLDQPSDPAAKVPSTTPDVSEEQGAFAFGTLSTHGSDPTFFYLLADALGRAAKTQHDPVLAQYASAMRSSLGPRPGASVLRAPSAPTSAQLRSLQLAQKRQQGVLNSMGVDTPAGQYALFQQHGAALAQPLIDQLVAEAGTGAHAVRGAQLNNLIGTSLGYQPANGMSLTEALSNGPTLQSNWFSGQQLAQIKTIEQQIYQVGGGLPQVTVVPVVYALPQYGIQSSALFRVKGIDGQEWLIDDQGMKFTSVQDYQDYNQSTTQGKVVLPADAAPRVSANGSVALMSINAHSQSTGQRVWADLSTAGIVVGALAAVVATAGAALPEVAAVAVAADVGDTVAGSVVAGDMVADAGDAVLDGGDALDEALSMPQDASTTPDVPGNDAEPASSQSPTQALAQTIRTLKPWASNTGHAVSALFGANSVATLSQMAAHGQSISISNAQARAAWFQLISSGFGLGAGASEAAGLDQVAGVAGKTAMLTAAEPLLEQGYDLMTQPMDAQQRSAAWRDLFEGLAQMALGAAAGGVGERIGQHLSGGANIGRVPVALTATTDAAEPPAEEAPTSSSEPAPASAEQWRDWLESMFAVNPDLRLQAVFDRSGLIHHYEVLLGEFLGKGPAVSVPHLEQHGLSVQLDNWVTAQSIGMLADHVNLAPLAVNLSTASMSDPDLAQRILDQVRESGIRPERLSFELTETGTLGESDWATAKQNVERLRTAGFHITVDDFDRGIALDYMTRLRSVDGVKIDYIYSQGARRGADVTGLDGAASPSDVRHAIATEIRYAHQRGATVVVEGISSPGLRRLMSRLGADYFQGYALHRPENAESILARLPPIGIEPPPAEPPLPEPPSPGPLPPEPPPNTATGNSTRRSVSERLRGASPSSWVKMGMSAGAIGMGALDPTLAHAVLTQGFDLLRYLSDQLVSNDEMDWVSRATMLTWQLAQSHLFDQRIGSKLMQRIADGTASDRDVLKLQRAARNYIRAHIDASKPAEGREALDAVLQASLAYREWINGDGKGFGQVYAAAMLRASSAYREQLSDQSRATMPDAYTDGLDHASVTASLVDALASLNGIDGYDPIGRSSMDQRSGAALMRSAGKLMRHVEAGTASVRDLLKLQRAARNYIRAHVDPSKPAEVRQALDAVLEASSAYGKWLSDESRKVTMPDAYRSEWHQAVVTATLIDSLGRLKGIDAYDPKKIGRSLFDRTQYAQYKLPVDALNAFTKGMNIDHSIGYFFVPKDIQQWDAAWHGFITGSGGFVRRVEDFGSMLNNSMYIVALTPDVFDSTRNAVVASDRVLSWALPKLGEALAPARERLSAVDQKPGLRKLIFWSHLTGAFFWNPGDDGWASSNLNHLSELKNWAPFVGRAWSAAYCIPSFIYWAPKEGAIPDSSKPYGVSRLQNRWGWRWTQKDWSEVRVFKVPVANMEAVEFAFGPAILVADGTQASMLTVYARASEMLKPIDRAANQLVEALLRL
jgi:EAL domain-containing protein (putative c-di-GMP-specific phosphodiesterase class I)